MKKILLPIGLLALTSCGGDSVDGTKLAQEVCDCYKAANASDDAATEASKCNDLNKANTEKVLQNTAEYQKYIDKFSSCEG